MSSTGTPIAGTNWFMGTGRRKESIARVFLRVGSGKFTVNKRTVEQYFPNFAWKHDATEPLKFTSLADQVDVVVTARGGGVGGQAVSDDGKTDIDDRPVDEGQTRGQNRRHQNQSRFRNELVAARVQRS